MLSEIEHRRPDVFDEEHSVPIVLGDGQAWYFPKPILSLRPIVVGGKWTGTSSRFHLGPDFDEARKSLEAIDPDNMIELLIAWQRMAVAMLVRNYDLPDETLGDLIDSEHIGWDTLAEIKRVATGEGPKPSPAGDDSPSTLPAGDPTTGS